MGFGSDIMQCLVDYYTALIIIQYKLWHRTNRRKTNAAYAYVSGKVIEHPPECKKQKEDRLVDMADEGSHIDKGGSASKTLQTTDDERPVELISPAYSESTTSINICRSQGDSSFTRIICINVSMYQ